MKTATIREIKQELGYKDEKELIELCLSLAKFKKENKELLTYLLYEASDEDSFIKGVNEEVSELFSEINRKSFYFVKKSIRKILRLVKKYIRYSKKKETQVRLLIHFCREYRKVLSSFSRSPSMLGLYQRQLAAIEKAMTYLHEDLQYDYQQELSELEIDTGGYWYDVD